MDLFRISQQIEKGLLIGAHTSDIHFGVTGIAVDTQYKILKEQFVDVIKGLPLDYVSINGDIFDHKNMADRKSVV